MKPIRIHHESPRKSFSQRFSCRDRVGVYYEHRCFLPLYVYCGPHLLLAQLRPGNVDGAKGARNVIRRIVHAIRARWPKGLLINYRCYFAAVVRSCSWTERLTP